MSGELLDGDLETVLLRSKENVVAGNNLYPQLAALAKRATRGDEGWSFQLVEKRKKNPNSGRVTGLLQWTRFTYRYPKVRQNKTRYRPGSVKCVAIDFTLWREIDETEFAPALLSLIKLADERSVKLRPTAGGFGSALLRASPEWEKGRLPAPFFISDAAREHLPGNYYQVRAGHKMKRVPNSYYIDQISSHHTIASNIDLPHPQHIHRRGPRSVLDTGVARGEGKPLSLFHHHIGVLICIVECSSIPRDMAHLYPRWAQTPGVHSRWIWTPELRLLTRLTRIRHVSLALTATRGDPALREYATWALGQRDHADHPIVKSALLPAYGTLASANKDSHEFVTVSSRPRPPRSEAIELPLIPDGGARTRVTTNRRPATQNVIARGVLEAESTVRSLEYARDLERSGIPVVQIYADAVIAATTSLPFVPPGWRIVSELTDWSSTSPNTFISNEVVRMPGIPHGQRRVRIEQTSSKQTEPANM